MKRLSSIPRIALIALVALASTADAQLYLGTAQDSSGNLYTVDPATAAATLIGPVLLGVMGGTESVDITGLAFQPGTNTLYAVTAALSNDSNSLVTIDPATANATLIGALGGPQVGDITFSAAGILYGWQKQQNITVRGSLARTSLVDACQDGLVTIDLGTGESTPVAPSGLCNSRGSGLAFLLGTLYVSAERANGALRTVDPVTGIPSAGVTMNGSATPVAALAASPAGILFGALNDSTLVTIDPGTGAVTTVGSLPSGADALAFLNSAIGPGGAPGPTFVYEIPTLGRFGLLVLVGLLAVAGLLLGRTR